MIDANRALFARLEDHCASRDDPIATPGVRRYIETNGHEKYLLRNLIVGHRLHFGRHRALVQLRVDSKHYVGLIGFDFEPPAELGLLLDNNAGFVTCLLAESDVLPVASTVVVRNVVEAGQMDDADYTGHLAELIESLFPSIQIMQSLDPLDDDAAWRAFLTLSAAECMQGGSWIDKSLADSLIALTGLDIPSMPYSALSRSIFDADPRSLFMALYRCIEATYSHRSSKRLIAALNLNVKWQRMAEVLESELGWHPQEAASLNVVLESAKREDLEAICACLNFDLSRDAVVSAGRAIYSLRNSIVHFRPGTREVNVDDIDWNLLCCLMVDVTFDVFVGAFV